MTHTELIEGLSNLNIDNEFITEAIKLIETVKAEKCKLAFKNSTKQCMGYHGDKECEACKKD